MQIEMVEEKAKEYIISNGGVFTIFIVSRIVVELGQNFITPWEWENLMTKT